MQFIVASESAFFIRIFRLYCRFLFYKRFKRVWLKQSYHPAPGRCTVYYLNHHSWWDGLIPLMLNEYCFNQKARALMEDKQMKQYPFFSKIGAFSVDRDDPRRAIISLRYAVQSMQRKNACLFIYPEGKITPAGSKLRFEGGLSWLHSKLPDVDFVPVAIYQHTLRYDKPELYLNVGETVGTGSSSSNKEKTKLFEESLQLLLDATSAVAGFSDDGFSRFI